jgi:hypothetical protein
MQDSNSVLHCAAHVMLPMHTALGSCAKQLMRSPLHGQNQHVATPAAATAQTSLLPRRRTWAGAARWGRAARTCCVV